MLFACEKKIFIKVSMVRRSRLVIFFYFKQKVLCFAQMRDVYFDELVAKIISPVIFDTSFTQTVKMLKILQWCAAHV